MRDLPDIQEEHDEAVQDHGFSWADNHRVPSKLYTGAFERCKFKMLQEGSKTKTETYEPGNFVSVNLPSKEGPGRGDAYAPSIARIEAVFEDSRGCCHVALRYFWRWGQIHAGADLQPAMRPSYRAQLFLQKEVTQGPVGEEGRGGPPSHNTLRYADGCFKELQPAIQLNNKVTVLSKADVVRGFLPAGGSCSDDADVAAALARYEANWSPRDGTDPDSGARSNGFWFNTTFDHTCYKFEAVTAEDLPAIQPLGTASRKKRKSSGQSEQQSAAAGPAAGTCALPSSSQGGVAAESSRYRRLSKDMGLTMGDAFCGLGTVSIAANEVGWQVEFGIDSGRDAMASFRANTAHTAAAPFNTVTNRPPADLPPMRVEQVVSQLRSGRLALPAVDWLHLSPPCQNVSQKKKLDHRVLSGEELRSAVELVSLLAPSFVTLEEVPGFLAQKFLPQNLKGVLAGYPNQPSQPQHSSSSAPHTAASAKQDSAGEAGNEGDPAVDSDDGEGGEDDQEGEGVSDVAEDDATEEDAAAAAGDSSSHAGSSNGAVLVNPVLLVVPALLDLGYQIRLCLLNAACYGAPQSRYRVVMFAAKQGCQLPQPPAPRYALPPGVQPRRVARDTGFLYKNSGPVDKRHGEWLEVLAVTPDDDPQALPPAITLQEACGDLPPLNPPSYLHDKPAAAAADQQQCSGSAAASQQQQKQQTSSAQPGPGRQRVVWLGEEVAAYRPEAGLMNCPLPLEALQQRGCRPVSRFSRWARSPHVPHQALRSFSAGLLLDHCVKHPTSSNLAQLLALPEVGKDAPEDDREHVEAMSASERYKLRKKGRRPAADGLLQCVLGHNEPSRFCMHFSENRYLSLAERRRGQSLPDWVVIKGNDSHREQQVGNAVPFLLAAEVAAAVWQAATGEPGRRPPLLNGPCPEGTGIADPLLLAQHYVPWLQQQQQAAGGSWSGVLQACRQQLQQEARDLQEQQRRSRQAALQQQQQQQEQEEEEDAVLPSTQQASSGPQQVQQPQHLPKPKSNKLMASQQQEQQLRCRKGSQVPSSSSRKRPRDASGARTPS